MIGESGKLDGSNYALWKFKITNILVARKLWVVDMGDFKEPTRTETDTKVINRWDEANAEAFALIGMTIVDSVIPQI